MISHKNLKAVKANRSWRRRYLA